MKQVLVIFMEKVSQNLPYFSPEMKLCLLTSIQDRLISYYCYHLLPELKNFLDKFDLDQNEKNGFLAKLENFHVHHTENEEGNAFITTWSLAWEDTTLEGRLKKFLVTPDQMHSFKEDIAQKYKENLQSLAHEVLYYAWTDNVFEDIIFEPRDELYVSRLLGETLGYEDVSLIFLQKIENIKKMGSCPFLDGYFIGMHKQHNKLPDELLMLLSDSNERNENFVIWATTCFNITREGYQKLLQVINTSNHILYISNLEISEWRKLLSESEKLEILTTILATQHSDRYKVFFTVASSWIQEGTSFSELFLLYLTVLGDCFGKYQAFLVTKALKHFPPEYKDRILKLICKDFRFDDFYNENNCYILEYLKRVDDCETNSLMMEYLGNAMIEQSKNHHFFSPHKGIFDMFQTKVVLDWIDVAPRERAPLIAFHLSTPTETFPEIPTLTRELSSKCLFSEVSHEFRSGFIYGVFCVDSLYAQRGKLLKFYQQYTNSEVVLIREWAECKIEHLEWECRNHEKRMAESKRYE